MADLRFDLSSPEDLQALREWIADRTSGKACVSRSFLDELVRKAEALNVHRVDLEELMVGLPPVEAPPAAKSATAPSKSAPAPAKNTPAPAPKPPAGNAPPARAPVRAPEPPPDPKTWTWKFDGRTASDFRTWLDQARADVRFGEAFDGFRTGALAAWLTAIGDTAGVKRVREARRLSELLEGDAAAAKARATTPASKPPAPASKPPAPKPAAPVPVPRVPAASPPKPRDVRTAPPAPASPRPPATPRPPAAAPSRRFSPPAIRLPETGTDQPVDCLAFGEGACQNDLIVVRGRNIERFSSDANGDRWTRVARLDDLASTTGSRIDRPEAPCTALAVAPDGRTLAIARGDVFLASTSSSAAPIILRRGKSAGPIAGLAFSPDGARLAAAAPGDRAAIVWDTKSGAIVHRLRASFLGMGGDEVQSLAFLDNGRLLATGGRRCPIRIWNLQTGREDATSAATRARTQWLIEHGWTHSTLLSRRPDGGLSAASFCIPREGCLVDVASGHRLQHMGSLTTSRLGQPLNYFSPEGRYFCTTNILGEVSVRDVPRRIEAGVLEDAESNARSMAHVLAGHDKPLTRFAMSSDGVLAAASLEDGALLLWLLVA